MFYATLLFERTCSIHTNVLTLLNYVGIIVKDDSSDFLEGERMDLNTTPLLSLEAKSPQ